MTNPTAGEAAAFAQHLESIGTPQAEIAAFRAQFEPGTAPEPGTVPTEGDSAQPDPRELALLEQGATPPESPTAYQLPWSDEDMMAAELRDFDGVARQMLQHAGLPAAEGSTLAKAINDAASRAQGWSDADFELSGRAAVEQLQRVWGSETNAKLETARALVQELDQQFNGQLTAILETGPGNDPLVIKMIADAAERRAALAKAKGAKR